MPSSDAPHPGTQKLGLILAIVVAGFFCSLVWHYQQGAVHGRPYPLNTFLFRPDDQFNDFFHNYRLGLTNFAAPEGKREIAPGWGSTVIMFRAWSFYELFYPKDPADHGTVFYYVSLIVPWLISQAIFAGGIAYFVRKVLIRISPDCLWAKIMALTLCSYPVLICLDRSNFENTIFVLLAGFIFLYTEGKYFWSAVLLGIVIGVKPYGVVFLALPFVDRKFKEIAISVAIGVLMTLGALVLLPAGVSSSLEMMKKSMTLYTFYYVQGNEGLYFCSSLYGLAKVWMYSTHIFLAGLDARQVFDFMGRFMSRYFFFAAACYGVVVVLLCGFRMEFWKRVALLVCCMNLLPFICGDYRLIHFFIPMLLFLSEKERAWADDVFSVLFGLLLIPEGYVHFVFDPVFRVNPYEVSDSVVIHPMLMLALVFVIIFSVLRKPAPSDMFTWLSGFLNRSRGAKAAS